MKENLKINGGKGILIVFEGISGCGKSENVESLRSHLAGKGYKVGVIEWNSNKIIRGIIRKMDSVRLLTPEIYSFFQWLSFIQDYTFKIIPLLKKQYILLADRYVYTGLTRDNANGTRFKPGKAIYGRISKPDLVFFQDVDPGICYKRIQSRGKPLFYTNRVIKESGIIVNKDLFYLVKLRKEYVLLFNNSTVKSDTNIIWLKNSDDSVIKYADNYISDKGEMQEYVKTFN